MSIASLAVHPERGKGVTAEERAPLDPSRIARLFEAHADRMLRAAYRITGALDDAEDVLQSVFVRIVQRPQIVPPLTAAQLGPYLHRAAVNAALDLLRVRGRRPDAPAWPDAADLPAQAPAPTDPDLRGRLRDGLARLSPRAAEMVALRYLEGLSNQEVAERVGTTESVVGVTLHRARQTLRHELDDSGEEA